MFRDWLRPFPLYPRALMLGLALVLALVLGAYSALNAGMLNQDADAAGVTTTVTHVLPYQGRLAEPDTGAPKPDGDYSMTFRLYTAQSGGAAIWEEGKTVAVRNGLFSTFLGDATPLNLGHFNGQNLWVGVTVGSDPEATPRLRLGFGAYAFFAENAANAATLGGQAPAAFAPASHNHSASAITSGTLADERIPASITRDSEIMSIVLANDGSGSGLDADLLDGLDSTAFASADHVHSGQLLGYQGVNVNCVGLTSVTTTFAKLSDLGTFTKTSADSIVELVFSGRISVNTMDGTGTTFELRVNNTPSTVGRIRSIVKAAEVGFTGVPVSMIGFFTGLGPGSHTISLWVQTSSGTASGAFVDSGCWSSDHVVVKEYRQ